MSRLPKALILGLLIGMLGVAGSLAPFGPVLEENVGLHLLFKLRGVRKAPSDVVVVTLDKVSADNLDLPPEPNKWPRSLHARLIENLVGKGAAVIVFDMIFNEARCPEYDNDFAEAIRNARNVVLCESLKRDNIQLNDDKGIQTVELDIERLVPPIPSLAQSAVALAPFPLPKVPVKVSRYWIFKTGAGDTPTLPVVAFQVFAFEVYDEFVRLLGEVSPSQKDKIAHDKDEIIASGCVVKLVRILRNIFEENRFLAEKMLDEVRNAGPLSGDMTKRQTLKSLIRMYQGDKSRYINFYGPPGTIKTISYYQLLQQSTDRFETSPYHEQFDLKGKAVFVGLSKRFWPGQKDGFHTVFSQADGLDVSGVEIAASAFANLLEDMHVQPLGFSIHLAYVFLWGMGLGILCLLCPAVIAAISAISLSVLYMAAAQYQFKHTGSWYPLVIPLFVQMPMAYFGAVLWNYIDANRERKNIRKAFGYYLPDQVVDQLAKDMQHIKSSDQMVYGSCLFTDAERYTTLSESMDPRELRNFMNTYYEAMFEPVKVHDGVVSDVIGDSMLAIWATAEPDSVLRSKACATALDIITEVHRFNQKHDTLKLPTRIGIHSGYMVLGNIGAINHYEYTPSGDIVNTASRIECLNKHLGTRILLSEDVVYQIDGFLTRELGEFLLVGKTKPIVIYELICRMEDSKDQQRHLCTEFAEALTAYRRQSWEEAIRRFSECMKIQSGDGPSMFYLKLCEKYRIDPPSGIWDGLVRIDKK